MGGNWVEETIQLIKVALGLPNEGITETKRNYSVVEQIPKKGAMHQVKDESEAETRAQF